MDSPSRKAVLMETVTYFKGSSKWFIQTREIETEIHAIMPRLRIDGSADQTQHIPHKTVYTLIALQTIMLIPIPSNDQFAIIL